mgnify:FL=1
MRKKTYNAFRNYVEDHVNDFLENKDIKKAWKLYKSDDSKYNDYSVEYCVDMILEIKELTF